MRPTDEQIEARLAATPLSRPGITLEQALAGSRVDGGRRGAARLRRLLVATAAVWLLLLVCQAALNTAMPTGGGSMSGVVVAGAAAGNGAGQYAGALTQRELIRELLSDAPEGESSAGEPQAGPHQQGAVGGQRGRSCKASTADALV